MHLLVCFLSDSFSRWSWSTRGRGLSTLCEACASFVVVWLCSFCYVVWLQMQKNFHHATILQFISSFFLRNETENWKLRGNATTKKKKNPLDPYVLIWQRMHSLYLGEWSSETLLFPTKLQPMNLQKNIFNQGVKFFCRVTHRFHVR